MGRIKADYLERVYAGWLGKVIGVRLGAPIEGWTYEKIRAVYGEIDGYLVDYKDFAADDDTNGPMFFLRALEDYTHTRALTAEQIGLTWLNYAPYEHGFYWWGGYGRSTEHTAYLNLRRGIPAPRSGSIEQNGATVAEQIGGQIFIDAWGLVVPGDPALAAEYAEKAASVAHDGNGKFGGMFVAACISRAFDTRDIGEILEAGLSVIPANCAYAQVARDVMAFHAEHPDDWHACFAFLKRYYGYDKWPGNCHIIPNAGVVVLSLLYGAGDFSRAICICNMCGWDTDCNVANVGSIMGVAVGLRGIDYDTWRLPVHDLLLCSSVVGSLNILDIPWCARYIAGLAYKIAGEEVPARWTDALSGKAARYDFELPGSTHSFRAKADLDGQRTLEARLTNSEEFAHGGYRSLKLVAKPLRAGDEMKLYVKTYYHPKDLHDDRYAPCFSPLLYPGQEASCWVYLPEYSGEGASAALYARDDNRGTDARGERIPLAAGTWQHLTLTLPRMEGALLGEVGVVFSIREGHSLPLVAYIDDFHWSGAPDYSIDFAEEQNVDWTPDHHEVSQFTYLGGQWRVEDDALIGQGGPCAEAYTGSWDWEDYRFTGTIRPEETGVRSLLNFRVQGAIRSYAAGLVPNGKLALYKNENGYRLLAETDLSWQVGREYAVEIACRGPHISARCGEAYLDYEDADRPYLRGSVGASLPDGGRCGFKSFSITPA